MTLTVTKKEVQEIELSFPVYKKLDSSYYKGISESEWIQLMPLISGITITDGPYGLDKVLTEGEDVNVNEFNQVFAEVFNKIKNHQP